MRIYWTILTALVLAAPVQAQKKTTSPGREAQPKLAVSIVVDQMRADYLSRFASLYTGGFKRLISEGQVFRNGHYTHSPTYTGPGHAVVYTGTDP